MADPGVKKSMLGREVAVQKYPRWSIRLGGVAAVPTESGSTPDAGSLNPKNVEVVTGRGQQVRLGVPER